LDNDFTDYTEARRYAQTRANDSGLDVAIRKGKSILDRGVYYVTYAARNDSDYALAEIVTPESVSR
jgi:hypothetical protein